MSKLRIDKWLWHARFFKTRSLAARVVSESRCRVNGTPISKPAFAVEPGDVLTFPQARDVRVIRIEALGERRGPAPEAQALYTDLDPPKPRELAPPVPRFEGKGRPTKRDRRMIEKSRSDALE
ncbi:RNA-binding S4 domain-containing protein [Cognatishimia sp. F0-27]|uniref:RNA-binding S4 domain-containing protein n=1 Tax=Cognatishimia sp. F0-27 TaxID=2816855 RepID=UPI001D0C1F72|nr:RNA-binding S4 domain-containing protein [Cognatishimia sp. F0-27]MCC1494082.1 RNA-binding S4 domain-containing protein [Cognatishimia sp. F0-27]